MHGISDLLYGIDLRCDDNYLSIVTPNSFSLLELSIADSFIFIVTGLYGERKR